MQSLSPPMAISHRKYTLEILEEPGMSNVEPMGTPMDPFLKLVPNQVERYSNHGRYKLLFSKLNYLNVTHSSIAFALSIVVNF